MFCHPNIIIMVYTFLKFLHILAVVVFLGNIITAMFWMHFAAKSRDLAVIRHTIRGVIKADRYFTIPGVSVLFIMGLGAAMHGKVPIFETGWILWSLILLLVSGFAFSAVLAPLQRKMLRFVEEGEKTASFNWAEFGKLLSRWDLWGLIATLTPLAAFVMMVFRVPA